MKDYTRENEENAQPPEPQGDETPEQELLEEEEQEEPVQWDGSEAEIVAEGADEDYKDTITGVKLSYVLTEEEIRTCMRATQFDKRRKKRMRIQLIVFSVLFLAFLVLFFLNHNADNLFFATGVYLHYDLFAGHPYQAGCQTEYGWQGDLYGSLSAQDRDGARGKPVGDSAGWFLSKCDLSAEYRCLF